MLYNLKHLIVNKSKTAMNNHEFILENQYVLVIVKLYFNDPLGWCLYFYHEGHAF